MKALRTQGLAIAWLRETRETRPALDVLRSDEPLSPQFRTALADWIEKGAKRRKKGSKVARDPWNEYPPELARSFGLATTERQERAWMAFVAYVHAARVLTKSKGPRGRPPSLRTPAIAHVAKKLGVTKRTAGAWFAQFARGEGFAAIYG